MRWYLRKSNAGAAFYYFSSYTYMAFKGITYSYILNNLKRWILLWSSIQRRKLRLREVKSLAQVHIIVKLYYCSQIFPVPHHGRTRPCHIFDIRLGNITCLGQWNVSTGPVSIPNISLESDSSTFLSLLWGPPAWVEADSLKKYVELSHNWWTFNLTKKYHCVYLFLSYNLDKDDWCTAWVSGKPGSESPVHSMQHLLSVPRHFSTI